MKRMLKSLVSILIILSMIFTVGIDLVQEEVVSAEKEVKEVVAEAPKETVVEAPVEKPVEEPAKPVEEVIEKPVEEQVEEIKKPVEKPVEEAKEAEEAKKEVIEEPVKETKEDLEMIQDEEEAVVFDPIEITLTDAETSIEDPIELGIDRDSEKNNHMEVRGGDGNYSYEWRISGKEEIFSDKRNPKVDPEKIDHEENIMFKLTVRDLSGNEERASMTLVVTKPKGSIRVTASTLNLSNEIFDIFIKGPGGSLYTVSLASGESKTIKNLRRGNYAVVPIVPMNYKSAGIENVNIKITKENYEKNTKVNYERTNNSWFYSR